MCVEYVDCLIHQRYNSRTGNVRENHMNVISEQTIFYVETPILF